MQKAAARAPGKKEKISPTSNNVKRICPSEFVNELLKFLFCKELKQFNFLFMKKIVLLHKFTSLLALFLDLQSFLPGLKTKQHFEFVT